MMNAINALSEDSSILSMGLFCNPWLILACSLSIGLHCGILYIPIFGRVFSTVALT
jgi:Ca2+-transporting ATPase